MSLTQTIVRVMNRIAPLSLAEKWDNVGLLIEAPRPRPHAIQVLLTIDLTRAVLQEALSTQTGMIVSYHPPIFRPLSALTLANPLQSLLLNCATAGISVYSPHTALDCVKGGVNDWLAGGVLGDASGEVSILGEEKEGGAGVGRLVSLSQREGIDSVAQRIKQFLKLDRVASPDLPSLSNDDASVATVALCAGSGGSVLNGVDADVYFTGEMAHVTSAVASGRHVILCGHTNTERGYLPTLAARLKLELIKEDGGPRHAVVAVSSADAHPLRYV
ncbi:hypothetical protein BS47DRAFT_1299463 [Hydnum rufescens UP504]|uniref:NGG1p interacting factor 3 n=1 Tax=Hydnum rufescens UP504 TaxID=1448309 RepID=A0A9P6ASE2_9AGAM|nr:hypothetical protein BS47DRAFT_1299463 [Hydnum rufescens UP504]